ncbi:hypothetical protein [Spirosoma pollinicola]|uniref:Uncharacterized protein n=1 Tax=Spirosoma pollinicola TaxID=2057025 RepID=A0A2K8Z8B5_9BACT|nr:hypothetical protein [Spirosoma pollinicola]AUD06117.1 hypothetical protein CWM47_32300 [Spirosoma pollinicola]
MNRAISTIVLPVLLACNLRTNAQVLVQQNGISLSYQEKYVNTIQCGDQKFDQYEVTAFLENRSSHTIDIKGYCSVDHIFYSNGLDYSPCRAPFPGGVTFDPKSNWPNNSTERGSYNVLVPAGIRLPAPDWNLASFQFKDVTNIPPNNTQPPSGGSPPVNSGGNYTYRPPNNSGNNYNGKPAGSQPRGIPYGNDMQCLNCGNEKRVPLPPLSNKPKGIPYGNAKTYGNLTMIASTAGPGPARQQFQHDNNEKAEDDDISKIDSSNPEEVLKWTTRQAEKAINELEELARLTKCPATAAAYRKLATYSRCTLKGGNCGLPPADEIPDCPADL